MQAYDVALFVHLMGLIAVFGGFVIYHRAGVRLRAARGVDQATAWLSLLDSAGPMFPGGLIMLLASGLFMTFTRWRTMQPWIVAGMIGLIMVWILGATIVDRHRRTMRRALVDQAGPLPPNVLQVIHNPLPWTMVAVLNGLSIGIVFVMSTKPQWLVATIALAAPTLAGALIGGRVARRSDGSGR
jgi:hypothetical protein